ncbi:MAG TPA: c-type cytochrome [Aggregatilinea sp.]|uniref:c-type cytochrome n=1 Tax=Aggregatilinea sp. TaxID=2806333 RepID=UPI002B661B4E|nr:c-type cytochrome [Aggregatilinea sp.]HML24529.1 c-type cytochrome [Aggregatilinea sp.]
MARRELFALIVLGLIVIGVPVAVIGYQYGVRPSASSTRLVDIDLRAPQNGGFAPEAITVPAGETVTLRFAAMDVTHGVAIGPGLGVDLGPIDPGEVKAVTLTFDHPGTYTFYCTTWCSDDHWRMRGTIQVIDPANPAFVPTSAPDPVIAALIAEGVDIDAAHGSTDGHDAEHSLTFTRPLSAEHGAALLPGMSVPAELNVPAGRRTHTPAQALDLLAEANSGAAQADLLDVIAHLWTADTSPETVAAAQDLYNQNCAACHGQYGGGDGPAAGTTAEQPVAFADPAYLFEMRSDVLYAKIRRGGMGTGMPNFGTLFTPEETWALVDYLWTLPTSTP